MQFQIEDDIYHDPREDHDGNIIGCQNEIDEDWSCDECARRLECPMHEEA